jgi:hypothetical protein
MAVDAVCSELVSSARSLMTRESTGKFWRATPASNLRRWRRSIRPSVLKMETETNTDRGVFQACAFSHPATSPGEVRKWMDVKGKTK